MVALAYCVLIPLFNRAILPLAVDWMQHYHPDKVQRRRDEEEINQRSEKAVASIIQAVETRFSGFATNAFVVDFVKVVLVNLVARSLGRFLISHRVHEPWGLPFVYAFVEACSAILYVQCRDFICAIWQILLETFNFYEKRAQIRAAAALVFVLPAIIAVTRAVGYVATAINTNSTKIAHD